MTQATYVRLANGRWAVRVPLADVGQIGPDGRVEVLRRDGTARVETIYGPISSDASHRVFSIWPRRGGGNDPDKELSP